ncbi:MAG: DUF4038 domain-containing protein [Terrimicrobiaceae bacterium]|nr:DUF4038 domain-containing protein [Terrimicrobiaceae bacterium]
MSSVQALPVIRVSSDRRCLEREDGKPFFYLGDTAWELPHRLTFSQAEEYLEARARKGFNVVQMVALAELDGLRTPAACGHVPFENCDPSRPVESYWRHLDGIVRRANELGLYAGLLPTWGDKWNVGPGSGPEIFTPETARAYGEWLGRRYREAGVFWVLGGDRAVETETHRAVIRAMARGLREGDAGRGLITFHPPGGKTSKDFWLEADWLDFDMFQSGHCILALENWGFAKKCREARPPRPFLDGEPCYEDHEVMLPEWRPVKPGWRFGEHAVRRAAWWSVLSGACGHVYGAQPCWMMWDERYEPFCGVRISWRDALDLPGVNSMRAGRAAAEEFGFPFEPLGNFVEGAHGGWEWTPVAGRSEREGRANILVYSPLPQELVLHFEGLKAGAWSISQLGLPGARPLRQLAGGRGLPGRMVLPPQAAEWMPDALFLIEYEL